MLLLRVLCLWCIFLVRYVVHGQINELQDPDVLVQPLKPKGFKVSIPHQEGIRLFAFHGNINIEFQGREAGLFARDIPSHSGGRWVFVDKTKTLRRGDTIYYWIFVDFFDGSRTLGYTFDGSYTVTGRDFVEDNAVQTGEFLVPDVLVEPLTPKGLRLSIPDRPGIKLFAIHLNVNEEMNGREAGVYAKDIVKQVNGRWTFLDRSIRLKKGDTLYYWYYVLHANSATLVPIGYTVDDQIFTVNNLVNDALTTTTTTMRTTTTKATKPPKTTTLKPGCDSTPTKINGGRSTCKGKILLQENFANIAPSRWQTEIRFADEPDYEFVSYSDNPDIIFAKKNILNIKPKLAEELYGEYYIKSPTEINLGINCTGHIGTVQCEQKCESFRILPPVVSGRINTSPHLSFKYGVVEVRAKLPKGDWLYPELILTPKKHEYGSGYESGELKIAFLGGNVDMSSNLYGGVIMGHSPLARKYAMRLIERQRKTWNDDFHVFKLIWSPDSVKVFVDDEIYGTITAPDGGFAAQDKVLGLENTSLWKQGSLFAPFDHEMIVAIGVGAGGFMFPDDPNKPWINNDPKNQRQFYADQENWKQTWGPESVLQVDYIKVWAL